MNGATWTDLWREGDSSKFNMYEQGGDGSIVGHCEVAVTVIHGGNCDNQWWTTRSGTVDLHCWNW